ncbi:SDR family oxidoreductase [Pseudomonadota bacterium AL_CKDN230030165-1A_HGKHYDSX7]
MKAKKVVVVGGTGLIGSKVVALLRAAGHDAAAASPNTGVNTLTGEGLDAALAGADVVIDVSNSPSFEPQAVKAFFETSTHNLLAAEARAGVGHHVILSIVGTDRMPGNGYFAAKVAQETLIKAGPVPYSIVRATQFLEFLGGIADATTSDGVVRLAGGLFQPIAADDVAAAVAEVAQGAPLNGTTEIAGPERAPFDEIVARYLALAGDARRVERDAQARYFGGVVEQESLVPTGPARLGGIGLAEWVARRQPAA